MFISTTDKTIRANIIGSTKTCFYAWIDFAILITVAYHNN